MRGVKRLQDWTSLSQSERATAAASCRRRTETLGASLNAVAAMLPEAGTSSGPLAGLPYAAKDLFATGVHAPGCGLGSGFGRAATTGEPRAEVLNRLDHAGARPVAAAEMTALAYEPSGYNAVRGRVLNPWDFQAITGGSSSGSAALVAAGCVFAALGSDTGGSVRIPASCCGVTSLKPTFGAIPATGAMPLAPSLDTIGLFARSARDLMLLWPVVSGQTAAPPAVRTAVRLHDFFEQSAPGVRAACNAAVDAVAMLGVTIASANGFPDEADRHTLTVMQAEAARTHGDLSDDRDPTLRKRMAKGLEISDATLAESLAARDRLREAFLGIFGDADVAVTPVMPIDVPDAAETEPPSARFKPRTLYSLSRFTRFVNFIGLPAMSVPAGFDDNGRPVGLQIVGRPHRDLQLLALAASLQETTDWHGRVPAAVDEAITKEGEAAA
jgi:aspartyl-tRNA(Asn)/glutamyl-tRNA(Gln) amidotransferase subunit A